MIDVPDAWGMLLSRKTGADLGGNIQMDLTYATIPTPEGTCIRLNRELEMKYHVEDPVGPRNGPFLTTLIHLSLPHPTLFCMLNRCFSLNWSLKS